MRFLSGWFVNVATLVHSDEGLLAMGFIFTLLLFNTHLRPGKSIVVFTGRTDARGGRGRQAWRVPCSEGERRAEAPGGTVPPGRDQVHSALPEDAGHRRLLVAVWIICAMLFAS